VAGILKIVHSRSEAEMYEVIFRRETCEKGGLFVCHVSFTRIRRSFLRAIETKFMQYRTSMPSITPTTEYRLATLFINMYALGFDLCQTV
jgi:hypothetical protein